MVNPQEFKQKITGFLSQEYEVEFLGKQFDQIVGQLSDIKTEKIYQWIEQILQDTIQPIFVGSNKQYKEWKISELLTFRYQFSMGTTEYRILFVKVKNSIYLEFHLGDHKYYDKVRKDLDLKKNSY